MKFGHYSNEELGIKRNLTCAMFTEKGVDVGQAKDVECGQKEQIGSFTREINNYYTKLQKLQDRIRSAIHSSEYPNESLRLLRAIQKEFERLEKESNDKLAGAFQIKGTSDATALHLKCDRLDDAFYIFGEKLKRMIKETEADSKNKKMSNDLDEAKDVECATPKKHTSDFHYGFLSNEVNSVFPRVRGRKLTQAELEKEYDRFINGVVTELVNNFRYDNGLRQGDPRVHDERREYEKSAKANRDKLLKAYKQNMYIKVVPVSEKQKVTKPRKPSAQERYEQIAVPEIEKLRELAKKGSSTDQFMAQLRKCTHLSSDLKIKQIPVWKKYTVIIHKAIDQIIRQAKRNGVVDIHRREYENYQNIRSLHD